MCYSIFRAPALRSRPTGVRRPAIVSGKLSTVVA
jgi:hypothetical protein